MNQELVTYTVEDLQDVLKIGRSKAYQLISSDGFPSFRLNRKWLVTKSNLEKWMDANIGKTYNF